MIIDGHTHIHPRPNGFGSKYDASVASLIQAIRQSPVDKAVVLPIAPEISNEFVVAACREYPDELIGFASVDPRLGKKAVEKLEEEVTSFGLKGLKLHPRRQGFGYRHFLNILPLIQQAAKLNIPVLIDTFLYGQDFLKGNVLELVNDLAIAVPKAMIIMAHMGGHRVFDAFMIAKANKNIYLDISYTLLYYRHSSIEKDIGFIIKKMGAERVVYGSDHPEMPLCPTFEESIRILEQFKLTARELDGILGKNIADLVL